MFLFILYVNKRIIGCKSYTNGNYLLALGIGTIEVGKAVDDTTKTRTAREGTAITRRSYI